MAEITLELLMKSGVHFGHQTKRWNPKMRRYIFTSRNGIYILDLQQTVDGLKKAKKFVTKLVAGGGNILFVGTKPQAQDVIKTKADELGMPYVTERWLGGMLTNFETVKNSISRLRELETMADDGTFEALSKKESTKLSKEKDKLQRNLGGICEMKKQPDAIFIVDTKKERIALAEAIRLSIPVIAIVDTNCDPEGIDFVIPGNDDAVRGIEIILESLSEGIREGQTESSMKRQVVKEEKAKKDADDAAIKASMEAYQESKSNGNEGSKNGEAKKAE